MPLLRWTDEAARYLRDAAERSDYYERLAAAIVAGLGGAEAVAGLSLCDAGCGLGYLALELARYARSVAAIDEADAALDVLRENIAGRGVVNVEPLRADMWALPPDTRFDVLVFCLFGSLSDILRCAAGRCGRAVIVKRDAAASSAIGARAPRRDSLAETLRMLEGAGIPYARRDLRLSLDQPLRTPADAARFIGLYGAATTPDAARRRLIAVPDHEFPYRLPVTRALSILTLDLSKTEEA